MQIYDQEDFVKEREGKIKEMHKDAKDIRNMAGDINAKIYDGGNKLDDINKKMGTQVNDIKAANTELVATREITSSRNKCACYITVLALVLASVLGVSIYFMIFK